MIKRTSIRNFACRYHRNGVSGAGFFACSFLFRDGRNWLAMQAAVFSDAPGFCAVTVPGDLNSAWRGDNFESLLRELIEEAGDDAFRHEPSKPGVAS